MFDAVRIVEDNAYQIVHGIVDSLWLKKRNAGADDYAELCMEIKKEAHLPVSFEGIYKWVVFLPSKIYNGLPVINRYFGVFKNGGIKVRGIEIRKHDTPRLIKKCQLEMIEVMARHSNSEEVRENVDKVAKVLQKYIRMLEERKVPIEELIINRRLSKNGSDYKKDILQAIVCRHLARYGKEVNAGEMISYVITDFYNKNPDKRVVPADLIYGDQCYDVRKYSEMLLESANTILNPFGVTNPLQMKLDFRS
jgi:DNA polymerase-2